MKRIVFLLIGGLLLGNVSFGQAVDDRAVIPVAVTLSSILRLNVVSGGNIEFSFNTLADYEEGIGNSAAYDTEFTVASSVDWDVFMYAEDDELVATDDAGMEGGMDLGNIGYQLATQGTNTVDELEIPSHETVTALTSDTDELLVGYDGTNSNAGDINANAFTIHWECATAELQGVTNLGSVLSQGLAADRYSTNVFLILQPHEGE